MAGFEQSRGMSARHFTVRRDHHTLAGGQPVVFHHPGAVAGRRPEPVQRCVQKCWAVHDLAGSGTHTGGRHHVFGEGFGSFDLGRRLAGPEAGNPGVAYGVGHPEYQRNLGADDHQVGPDLAGQRDDVVARGDIDIVLVGYCRRAGIAGRDGHRLDLRIGAQRQQEGMFAGTGADHQNAHETSL